MSYDPTVGRWLEQDPDTYIDGPNRYQFEKSNPIIGLDPTGTKSLFDRIMSWDPWGFNGPKGVPGGGVNCMQYATGQQNWSLKDALTDGVLTPAQLAKFNADGTGATEMNTYLDDPWLFNRVLNSFFKHRGLLPPGADAKNPDPKKYHKVRVYVYLTPCFNADYHVIQQHTDGSWSGKHGISGDAERTTPDGEDEKVWGNKIFVGEWWILGPTVDNPVPDVPEI